MTLNSLVLALCLAVPASALAVPYVVRPDAAPPEPPPASITYEVEGGCFAADGWIGDTYSGSFAVPQFAASLGTLQAVEIECTVECGWTLAAKAQGTGCGSSDWRIQMPRANNLAWGDVHLGGVKLDASGTQQIPATLSAAGPVGTPDGFPCNFLSPNGKLVLQQPVQELGNGSSVYTDAPLLAAVTGTGAITLDLAGYRQVGISQSIPCGSAMSCTELTSQACFTGQPWGPWQVKVSITYHYQ